MSVSFIYFNQASSGMADGHKIPVGTKVQAVYSEDGEWYTFLSCFSGFLLFLKERCLFDISISFLCLSLALPVFVFFFLSYLCLI